MQKSIHLTNLQLEILKVFATEVNEEDLREVKSIIANYFADKAIKLADKEWKSRGLTQEDMDQWLFEGKS
jgi:hypothetical protein